MWKLCCFVGFLASACAQSNYDSQANSIEYSGGQGLPESTILDGKVTRLDDLSPIIFLNRTKAGLNCAAGFMQIDLKFEHPFYGIVYADFARSSACTVAGNGTTTTRIELPLKGCGTRQDPTRVFTNNIVVRFHPSLEMDGDEVITIVCRYPPPVAPPPPAPPGPLLPNQSPPDIPLKGFQILLIICAILFLSLVLLGLAASYYCMRNQRIQIIRRQALPPAGSEITKISESSTGNLSMYDGLKIPRARTQMLTNTSLSESEMAIVSGADTIPSDYPSESPSTSHSEVEDVDGRSLRRSLSSSGSYENKAYVQENTYYTEEMAHLSEMEMLRHRPPPPEPKFNVEMRVKKAPLPSPTPSPSSSDTEGSLIMQERNLSTIVERDESVELTERPTTFTYKPEIHQPPKSPPIYSEVVRKNLDKTMTDMSKSEYVEETFERTGIEESDYNRTELSTDIKEPPVVVQRRPEITSHFVDDVFLRTITEKKTIEDIERHCRQVTEYHAKPLPLPTKWDVEIRNYPNPNKPPSVADDSTTDWDTHSENSSIYGVPAVIRAQELHRTQQAFPASTAHQGTGHQGTTATTTSATSSSEFYRTTLDIPVPNPPPANWDALVKILEYTPALDSGLTSGGVDTKETTTSLSLEDKKKWRKIITTESTLRTMLTEASVREDYERIRKDQRYEKLFEPSKWDVIIRILSPSSTDRLFDQRGANGGASSNRYRRKSDWDTRSRRNSLPTLYEYDSDGSSIQNLRLEGSAMPSTFDPLGRSRRTSRSSMRSDMDVRSMSEIMVDFARQDVPDNMSDGSSYYRPRRYYDDEDDEDDGEDGASLVRSLSQPSLARSASEFTESWGIRGRGWDSPEYSPRSSMRSTSHNEQNATASAYSTQRSMYQQEKRWFHGTNHEV